MAGRDTDFPLSVSRLGCIIPDQILVSRRASTLVRVHRAGEIRVPSTASGHVKSFFADSKSLVPVQSPTRKKPAMPPRPMSSRSRARKRSRVRSRAKKKDPIFVDGQRPRPMYVDYKDVELLKKMINRQGRIVGRRKSGCTAASQHAVTAAVKRARFMALLPYVGD